MKHPRLAHEDWKSCPAFTLIPSIMPNLMPNTFRPVEPSSIFRCFELSPQKVRAVIVGMSPYPGTFPDGMPHANGNAFAIDNIDTPYPLWPQSLKKICEAMGDIYPEVEAIEKYFDPTLSLWKDAGILLLNSALTTLPSDPRSHLKLWEPFTANLLSWLNTEFPGIIYYFMGSDAAKYSSLIYPLWNQVIVSEHPSRAARENRKFLHKFKLFQVAYEDKFNSPAQLILPF